MLGMSLAAAAWFGWQHWRALSGVRAGDIVVAISDRHDRGVALIPLRTRGRLTMVGWDRDVVMYDALPSLPARVNSEKKRQRLR